MFCLINRHVLKTYHLTLFRTSGCIAKPLLAAQLHSSSPLWKQLVQFRLSDIGEGIRQVTIKEWFVKPGDHVAQFDSVCEVQSDKAAVTITSRYDGVIKKLYYKVDDIGNVGQPLVDIEVEEAEDVNSDSEDADDVEQAASGTAGTAGAGRQQQPPPAASDRKAPIRGVQRAMFQSMTLSSKIPHFTYSDEIDLTRLFQWRKRLNKSPEVASASGGGLTFMPFFLKAMSMALREQPVLNAHLVEEDHLLVKASHNIGVAVDSPSGLLVPCVPSVEQLSVLEISAVLRALVEAGRAGKLTPGQLTGGTIALSNIGNIGGTYTKPVIQPPQVCIGAVGRARPLPRFDANGSVTAAQIMCVSWSADHRVIDGATVARFSNRWKQLLEQPEHFLLHLK